MTKEELLEAIEKMSVVELVEFVKALEEKFGVSGMPMAVPVAGNAQQQGGAPVQEEEKTTFDVVLTSVGQAKIQVIKVLREILNISLKEANDLVASTPQVIKKGVSQEEAEDFKNKLSTVGATVEIK
ncbi:MAG TPA: 50S ribosomal protein L7/L12 [Caldisericia bacterium]|nr:50S ribosomal protein L7/L12 [Caldisericia bacterium]HPB34074.1 50S ribosomal protein L7/L12 [Caldisericia bacterium]HQL67162.1 50S ribosomal protein L7/L12 [Caldisericia bacterium]HQN48235.1 50S ribosomal protein L7/L12 [Caldisericia bacterium]HQO99526.1 50S ribosomal protein L7/L12 [Caldisericia bacterium]